MQCRLIKSVVFMGAVIGAGEGAAHTATWAIRHGVNDLVFASSVGCGIAVGSVVGAVVAVPYCFVLGTEFVVRNVILR
jgi:hypothetical protein